MRVPPILQFILWPAWTRTERKAVELDWQSDREKKGCFAQVRRTQETEGGVKSFSEGRLFTLGTANILSSLYCCGSRFNFHSWRLAPHGCKFLRSFYTCCKISTKEKKMNKNKNNLKSNFAPFQSTVFVSSFPFHKNI